MSDYNISAANIIATYVWHRIQTKLGWSIVNYPGIIPVVPTQQQPELNSGSQPFIVFGYSIDYTSPLWLLNTETVSFTVFSEDLQQIREVTNLLCNDFKRYDESAGRVNNYISSIPSQYVKLKDFDLKTISIMGASGPQPSMQEGGRHDGNVILKVKYTHHGPSGAEVR